MGTPTEVTTLPTPDQPSTAIRDRDEAEVYVAMICFKHGPPRLLGVELEWTVHHDSDPRRALDPSLLSVALGPHAPQTINPHQTQLPLPAGSLITVEPGGQVEISTQPTSSATELIAVASADTVALAGRLARHGLVLGHQGTDPHRPPKRLLQVPRYTAMQAAFDRIGPLGSQMMCSTASMQVCLDAGEADQYASRWAAANALGPTLVALFANSPHLNGRPTGWASARLRATLGTCPPFTLAPALSEDPSAAWARLAMEAPVICVRGGESWAAPPGLTFSGWIAEPARVGRRATFEDLDYHLSTLFPPVRPKGYLEVRYLDAQPGTRWVTPFVLLAALMARPSTIDQVLGMTQASSGRWFQAARAGLADPVLGAAAHLVIQLGADCLDHLDLTATVQAQVLADLQRRLKAISTNQRCSA
jgi:glutamate--cysteine ligase